MAPMMCDVCGIRPAVVTVRRIVPGEGQRVEHLCEIHAAEAGAGRSSFGGPRRQEGSACRLRRVATPWCLLRERSTVQHRASRRRENALHIGHLHTGANPCNT